MKKYVSLLGALALGTTASLSVIALGPNIKDKDTTQSTNPNFGPQDIKKWSNQTSNVAKAILVSKNQNFNTNSLLNKTLNTVETNIEKNTDPTTGVSYDKFKSVWGYKGKDIEGITAQDFNSDSASTVDNNLIKTKSQITDTLKQVQDKLKLLSLISGKTFTSNKELKTALNTLKPLIAGELWKAGQSLKDSPEIIKEIEKYAPLVQTLVDNLSGFNAKEVLGKYYVEGNVKESLFGKNADGWLYNYKSFGDFTSEAIKESSSILDEKNFENWDQVALFKTSIDLNGLVWQWSGGKLTLGKIIENALQYQGETLVGIDFNLIADQITKIWTTTPDNIVNLISTLIPVIKTKLLNINPTKDITKISVTEKTDVEKGIINLGQLLSLINDNILTKEGFATFIGDMLFPEAVGKFKLVNYATFDFTSKSKPLCEVLLPIKKEILTQLSSLYETSLEPEIKKYGIKEIFSSIITTLSTQKAKVEINLTDVQGIAKILNNKGLYEFLNKLSSYKDTAALSADWFNLWGILGLQNKDVDDFIAGSVLSEVATVFKANLNFLKTLNNFLSLSLKIIPGVMDIIVKSVTDTAVNSLTSEANWIVDETTIEFEYDSKADESTIEYTLVDKNNSKNYKITTVVKGDASTPIGTDLRKVWLKAIL